MKWKYETKGEVWSSPVAGTGGTVFVGSFDGNLYAINATTGNLILTFETKGPVESTPVVGADGTA